MDNQPLDDLLKRDALQELENATGRHYTDLPPGVCLAHHMEICRKKKEALVANEDTTFSMEIEPYLAVAHKMGFETVLEEQFCGHDDVEEMYRVLWHAAWGLLLSFDSYGGKSVNSGNVYYNVWLSLREYDLHTSSGSFNVIEDDKGLWVGHHDCREGLKHYMFALAADGRNVGGFQVPWVEPPRLWLVHYGAKKSGDYKAENERHIGMLPPEVRSAISGTTEQGVH